MYWIGFLCCIGDFWSEFFIRKHLVTLSAAFEADDCVKNNDKTFFRQNLKSKFSEISRSISEMAVELLCGLGPRGKRLTSGALDDAEPGFAEHFLGLNPWADAVLQPPFVSNYIFYGR
jgi:hypothetical protein